MNYLKTTATFFVAVILVCFLPSALLAQVETPTDASTDDYSFDESLFVVEDGKDAAYYKDQLGRIDSAYMEYMRKFGYERAVKDLIPKAMAACASIDEILADSNELSEEERESNFLAFCDCIISADDDVARLEAAIERSKRSGLDERVKVAEERLWFARFLHIVRDKNLDSMRRYLQTAPEVFFRYDYLVDQSDNILLNVASLDRSLAYETIDRIMEALESAQELDKERQWLKKKLPKTRRLIGVEGSEIVLQGLLMDGTVFDWSQYSGKVVLIDVWATWCGPCLREIPNVLECYDKYHDKGFEVVGYNIDEDFDDLLEFEKEAKHPWRTISQALTLQKNEEATTPLYQDFTETYGVYSYPTMILVGRDGKAISRSARGARLRELLEQEFGDKEKESSQE